MHVPPNLALKINTHKKKTCTNLNGKNSIRFSTVIGQFVFSQNENAFRRYHNGTLESDGFISKAQALLVWAFGRFVAIFHNGNQKSEIMFLIV